MVDSYTINILDVPSSLSCQITKADLIVGYFVEYSIKKCLTFIPRSHARQTSISLLDHYKIHFTNFRGNMLQRLPERVSHKGFPNDSPRRISMKSMFTVPTNHLGGCYELLPHGLIPSCPINILSYDAMAMGFP